MWELFLKGGWAMYPLIILLVLGVGIAIERLYNLGRAGINADEFFRSLEEVLRSSGPEKAAHLCAETRGPVAYEIQA